MSLATPSQPPIRCTCMSARPGISTLPRKSVTRAPPGRLTDAAGPAATMRSPRTTTVARSTAAAPVPSMSTALVKACTLASVLLEQVSSLEADRARLIDHESRHAGHFRADQDGVAEVRVLVGEILDESRQLEARAPATQPQIHDVVG